LESKTEEYFKLHEIYSEKKKELSEMGKKLKEMEVGIKEWMEKEKTTFVKYGNNELYLIEKKIPQAFKKESIKESLSKNLKQATESQCEDLATSIMKNKSYTIKKTLKLNIV
jgi:hypothetical protein